MKPSIKVKNQPLTIAGTLSFAAALLHVACIIGGPSWYRFFGAGDNMVRLAQTGDSYPVYVTLLITAVLISWALYAWSGARLIVKLPLLKTCLTLITAVYLIRGIVGLIFPFFTDDPIVHQNSLIFWVVSSVICCIVGGYYFAGTRRLWHQQYSKLKN